MLHRRVPALALLLLSCAVIPAYGQVAADSTRGSAVRTLRAAPVAGEISIDGRLDEAAWEAAEVASDFTQSYPDQGATPTQRTEARVLFADDALYVGVRAYDSAPDSIAAQLARRDASGIYSDWIHVVIDSYRDRRSGYRFTVNPRGIQKDVYHYDDGNEDVNWDAVWQVGTSVDSLGWTAEYRIPLSQLRFDRSEPAGGRVWGFQVQRDIARRDERATWSPWTRTSGGYVARFGDLTGIRGIRPSRRIELLPYVSARLTRAPGEAADPFYSENDAGASLGADFKMGITSSLTLTGTINPDFGQVEVDPAVVNLSAFETFFPEKRPFFVDGADIFRFGAVGSYNNYGSEEYFYSRRIGRAPQRNLAGRGTVAFLDAPDQSTILGAAKLSGKVGQWTVGVMDAVTAEEEARILTTDGARETTVVEPFTNYFVGRLQRQMGAGNSVLGGMVTATHRDMADGLFTPILRSNALFAGVDGSHSWSNRTWVLSGYAAGTRVSGSREVITATQLGPARYYQRPDADYVTLDPERTSLAGHMAEIALQRRGALHFSLDYKETSPGFEINDLGFQGRTDYRSFTTLIGKNSERPSGPFRSTNYYTYSYHAWNFGGTSILQGAALGGSATLNNFWSAGGQTSYRPEVYDDRLTRGGPVARQPGRYDGRAWIESDQRKPLSLGMEASFAEFTEGAWSRSAAIGATYRPSSAVRLRLTPAIERQLGTAQYVTAVDDPRAEHTFGRRYVFADLEQTTTSLETRLDWTFSPTLSLQLFAQPFIAVGDYRNFKEFARPGSYDFDVYGEDRGTITRGASCTEPAAGGSYLVDPDGPGDAPCFSFGERDFNVRSLRGNAVLRWEYRPGSALFFVWQQNRDGYDAVGTFDLGRDAGAVFRAPAHNVFLIKATYWIGS